MNHIFFFWMIFDLCVQNTLGMTTLHLDIVLSLVSWPGGGSCHRLEDLYLTFLSQCSCGDHAI